MRDKIAIIGLVLLVTSAVPIRGAVLEIAYPSLERMLVTRVMGEGGRYYMEGDPSSTCRYSFIQEPRVDAVDGRLRITVLYSGRLGTEVAGKCIGPGDNFDVSISGVPTFSNGELFLSQLEIRAPETAYFKLVAPLIRGSLEETLRYPLKDRLDRATAWISSMTASGGIAMKSLQVESITVGEESIRLVFDVGVYLEP